MRPKTMERVANTCAGILFLAGAACAYGYGDTATDAYTTGLGGPVTTEDIPSAVEWAAEEWLPAVVNPDSYTQPGPERTAAFFLVGTIAAIGGGVVGRKMANYVEQYGTLQGFMQSR